MVKKNNTKSKKTKLKKVTTEKNILNQNKQPSTIESKNVILNDTNTPTSPNDLTIPKTTLNESTTTSNFKDGKTLIVISGIVLLLIIAIISFGIYRVNHDNTNDPEFYEYNGFLFVKQGLLWQTTIYKYTFINDTNANVQEVPLYVNYDPLSVENISFTGDISQILNGTDKLILSFDPQFQKAISFAGIEIGKILVSFYNWESNKIVVTINTIDPNLNYPFANCTNATSKNKVINFNFGNETSVTQEGNCFNVVAKESVDIIKSADLMMYKLLRIIP